MDRTRAAWLVAAEFAHGVFTDQAEPGGGYGDPMAERAVSVALEQARIEVQQRLLEYHDARDALSAQERVKADAQTRELSRASFV